MKPTRPYLRNEPTPVASPPPVAAQPPPPAPNGGRLRRAFERLAEGAGAVAGAAIRKRGGTFRGLRVGCVLMGGNASRDLLNEALAGN